MRYVLNSKGFTLVEILAVFFIIVAAGTVFTDFYRDHISSVRRQEALETLTNLNSAVDVYRSEFGDLPPGGNDAGHHQNILAVLSSTSYGRQLLESQSVCLAQLESAGNGENFRFTKYKGVDAPAVILAPEGVADGHASSTWVRDNDGIENLPMPIEATPLANSAAEARLASNPVHGSVTFDQPGKYEWIVPDGVAQIKIEGIGGGGSGGAATHWEGWGAPQVIKHNLKYEYHCYQGWVTGYIDINGRTLIKNITPEWPSYKPENFENWRGLHNYPIFGQVLEVPTGQQRRFWHSIKYYGSDWWRMFTLVLEVKRWEVRDTPGNGGKAGQYQQQTVASLKGGESVFIFVGKGGLDSNGEKTQVVMNGQSIVYEGGVQSMQAATIGEANAYLGLSGNGGQGQTHYNTPVDRRGKNGCVRIAY